jgi:NADH-quinone oxidoreductase subunit M
VLAGAQLKMGGYGLVRIVLSTVPAAAARYGWALVALGAVSIVYGALAALPQRDLKRLVAYTSVSHMGFVLLATGAAALTADPGVRALALTGATYQLVSHGLLTGGMFFVVGALQDLAGTRELSRLSGIARGMPAFSGAAALLALGSLGLPGLSGFVAELQVVGAAAAVSGWAAGAALLGILLTTAVYLRILSALLLGDPTPALARAPPPSVRVLGVVVLLAALAVALGVAPGFLVKVIAASLAAGA